MTMAGQCVRQSGVIPYRFTRGAVEILLVTASNGTGWLVPKGNLAGGLSARESAVKEAYEEAGVVGIAGLHPVGSFSYVKQACRRVVDLFPLAVTGMLAAWPEMARRRRAWAPADEAAAIVKYAELDVCILALADELRRASIGDAAA